MTSHVKVRPTGRRNSRLDTMYENRSIALVKEHPEVACLFLPAWVVGNDVHSEKMLCDGSVFMVDFIKTSVDIINFCEACFTLLDRLHSAGVAHGDAKVNNILVKELKRAPLPGEITFAWQTKRMCLVFCDYETLFFYWDKSNDAHWNGMIFGKRWYGMRPAVEMRARFQNVLAADVYALTSSILYHLTGCRLMDCLALLINRTIFPLKHPVAKNATFYFYVPDRTANYHIATAASACASLQALRASLEVGR